LRLARSSVHVVERASLGSLAQIHPGAGDVEPPWGARASYDVNT